MIDPDMISGQQNPNNSFTEELFPDLEVVLTLCNEHSEKCNKLFSSIISGDEGFFLKFLGPYSDYKKEILLYWVNAPIFDIINPFWDVKISTEVFNYLISKKNNHESINYLIHLLKGVFKIVKELDCNYLIVPVQPINENLFASIVKIKVPKKELKILVGHKINKKINKSIIGELLTYENSEILKNFKFDESLKIYKPGDFQMEETKNIEKSHTNLQYLNLSLPFRPSSEFNQNLPQSIEKLKFNIEKNKKECAKFFDFSKIEIMNLDWIQVVIKYFENQQSGKALFDIFSNFNIVWKIVIEKELLNILKQVEELELLHYLNEILKLATGQFKDLEEFESLNDKDNEDFLIAPLAIKNTNLKPIFSVLCLSKSYLENEFEYQLRLTGFYDDEITLNIKINEFKESEKYLKIFKSFGRPGM